MSFNCKYCGRELPDGAAFCEGCGSTFDTDKITCLSCGESLDAGTTLCPVCGARIYNTAAPDEGPAEMEALVPPVITDDMFATHSEPNADAPAIESADESVYMRPVHPASQQAAQRQTAASRPEPIPVPIRQQQGPTQSAPLLNRPRQSASPGVQPQRPVIDNTPDYTSTRSSGFAEAARPPQQPQQQAPEMPYQDFMQKPYPDPARMPVEQGKKGRSLLVPIILIILIIGVILFDVFYLFRDRIFGSDDSKSSKSAAVITVTDDLTADDM